MRFRRPTETRDHVPCDPTGIPPFCRVITATGSNPFYQRTASRSDNERRISDRLFFDQSVSLHTVCALTNGNSYQGMGARCVRVPDASWPRQNLPINPAQ